LFGVVIDLSRLSVIDRKLSSDGNHSSVSSISFFNSQADRLLRRRIGSSSDSLVCKDDQSDSDEKHNTL
jgi:hypothetical protein